MIFLIKPKARKFSNCGKNVCSEFSSSCLMYSCLKDYKRPESNCEVLMVKSKGHKKVKAKIIKK
ncbi:MAG: hypothetical protein Q4E02_00030 [Lagierella massiliensis]|nr:hypothetical protein [Lagierella massiliensis]